MPADHRRGLLRADGASPLDGRAERPARPLPRLRRDNDVDRQRDPDPPPRCADRVTWSHAPAGYACPFCRLVRGVETEVNRLDDVVYRDDSTTAFIAPKWWPANHGHVLVIPNAHVENIYAIDEQALCAVSATVKRVAVALKSAYVMRRDLDAPAQRAGGEPGRLAHARPRLPTVCRRQPVLEPRGNTLDDPGRARPVRSDVAGRARWRMTICGEPPASNSLLQTPLARRGAAQRASDSK